jgi:hypothetical protein
MAEANLTNACLTGANLTEADLSMAILDGASLTGADLRGVNLEGVSLEGADLYGADITGVTGKPLEKIGDPMGFCKPLAEESLGQGAIVTSARPGSAYRGEIVSVTDNGLGVLVLMAISDTHAILHEMRKTDVAPNGLETGAEASLDVDGQGYSSVRAENETRSQKREGRGH